MNIQIRKFYEMEEGGGGSINWYKEYCRVNKQVQEKDLIIYGLEEGSQNWKAEYDNCREILKKLVDLKVLKDELDLVEQENQDQQFVNKYAEYSVGKKMAWKSAKMFLENYQHKGW